MTPEPVLPKSIVVAEMSSQRKGTPTKKGILPIDPV